MANKTNEELMVLHIENKGNKGKNVICSYCKKHGHYRDKCGILHGRSNNRGKSNREDYYQQRRSENSEGNNEFRDSNLANLVNLLKQVAKSNLSINIENNNNTCNISMCLVVNDLSDKWILDSGANRHMIGNLSLLHNYCSGNVFHVQIANSSIVIVVGQG